MGHNGGKRVTIQRVQGIDNKVDKMGGGPATIQIAEAGALQQKGGNTWGGLATIQRADEEDAIQILDTKGGHS